MKYKVYRKSLEIWKEIIYLFPTIKIAINNDTFDDDNLTIGFYFLIFHAEVIWKKGWY